MIQPNELRLGNIVLFDNKQDEIFMIGNKMVYGNKHSHFYYERVHPIPLTPEVLTEWCGFAKDEFWWGDGINYFGNGVVDVCFGNEEVSDILDGVYFGQDKIPGIIHLHQLQNLTYFLTGQEMEVRLPK